MKILHVSQDPQARIPPHAIPAFPPDVASVWAGAERSEMAAELASQRRQLAREGRMCAVLQQRALQLEAALARADKRRATEAAAFSELLDARNNTFAQRLAQMSTAHDVLAANLAEAISGLEREREGRAADAETARAALAQHAANAEDNAIACESLERRLAETQSQYQRLLERTAADRAALEAQLWAAVEACQQSEQRANRIIAVALTREAELVEQLETESAAKAVAESHAAAARMATARRRDRSLLVASRYRRYVRAAHLDLTAQLVMERSQADRDRGISDDTIARLLAERDSLRGSLAAQHECMQSLQAAVQDERRAHEQTRSAAESDLAQATINAEQLQRSFDDLHAAFQQLDEVAGDHAAARVRLEGVVAERDRQLEEEHDRHVAVEEDLQRYIARLQGGLRQASVEHEAETGRLQAQIAALRREIEVATTEADRLRGTADRVPALQAQLEQSYLERRRQFERAPYAICRCSAEGTIVEANHSFVTLLGYRRAEDLKNLSWLALARERTGDLGWLLDRARATRKAESVETQWETREGRRLIVCLRASVTVAGTIDIVAEDVTTVRVLEARLRQAQKMEAVGRLASDVAMTCDALLADVVRDTREGIEGVEPADLRQSAERMLDEVSRARGFLRRLASYGDEQKRALAPVSTQRVLRDLAPVLKRLVGERIELVLPRSAGVFPVDIDAERLERLLTNVAGYARQRMPLGGQIKIDLATIAIGRRFAAGHASVRAGDHVLITVTEVASAAAAGGDGQPQGGSADAAGMELGVLIELISSCGGHLWLEAQPAGNMVLKIHLPKPAAQEDRGGRISRWIRAAAVANIIA
jgi:PAS domain S-box-containing protein